MFTSNALSQKMEAGTVNSPRILLTFNGHRLQHQRRQLCLASGLKTGHCFCALPNQVLRLHTFWSREVVEAVSRTGVSSKEDMRNGSTQWPWTCDIHEQSDFTTSERVTTIGRAFATSCLESWHSLNSVLLGTLIQPSGTTTSVQWDGLSGLGASVFFFYTDIFITSPSLTPLSTTLLLSLAAPT